jgi:predicted ribosomally synthesized peptide with nif11-like leader
MAKSAVEFVQDLLNDKALAREVEAAPSPEAVVLIGSQHGASFSVQELKKALASAAYSLAESLRGMGATVELELSVDDLEFVSGGNNNFTTNSISFSTQQEFQDGYNTVTGVLGKG